VDILWRDFLIGVLIKNLKRNEQKQIDWAAMFVSIEHTPETEILKNQLEVDDQGYFITNWTLETKILGVFVCGDCTEKVFRQAITTAGTGYQAAILAHRY
jgi:thioredoxin reductase (NADPH)